MCRRGRVLVDKGQLYWTDDMGGGLWMAHNTEMSHVLGAKGEIMLSEAMEDGCKDDNQLTNVIIS